MESHASFCSRLAKNGAILSAALGSLSPIREYVDKVESWKSGDMAEPGIMDTCAARLLRRSVSWTMWSFQLSDVSGSRFVREYEYQIESASCKDNRFLLLEGGIFSYLW